MARGDSASYELLCAAVRDAGYQLTRARQAILAAFAGADGHISADDLVGLVHEETPRVGRMTVYRTLDLLCRLGAIRPTYLGGGAAHYVLLQDGHHHHLVCTGCAAVIELEDCRLQEMEALLAGRFGFEIQGHLVEFYGRCAACRAAEAQ
jgi:Fur family ferric uptake transcriptional regulator